MAAAEIARFIDEAKEYIAQGDAVQASEKLYKAAEEAVKALAREYADGVWQEAREKGRWTSPLLFRAVRQMAEKLGGVRNCWDTAWTLHVEGFHEGRLEVDDVRERVESVEELVKLAENRRRS